MDSVHKSSDAELELALLDVFFCFPYTGFDKV